jgi:MFS family permease
VTTGRTQRPKSAVRRALGVSPFRRLFLAHTISRWGDVFNSVALVIVVFQLTGSGVKVGGVAALEIAPVLPLGFVAGTVVDRLPRRQVMVAADLGRALIAALLVLGPDHLWALYLAAFGLSALTVFFNPAAASVVPALVPEGDLVGDNSALWSAAVLSQIALAPLAGAVVAFAGPEAAFAINATSFLVSAVLLVGLAVPAAALAPI